MLHPKKPSTLDVLNDHREAFLTLGGPRSGTQFHAHGPAFLLLAAGKKRNLANPRGGARHMTRGCWPNPGGDRCQDHVR